MQREERESWQPQPLSTFQKRERERRRNGEITYGVNEYDPTQRKIFLLLYLYKIIFIYILFLFN
jgi:hypothetical protein